MELCLVLKCRRPLVALCQGAYADRGCAAGHCWHAHVGPQQTLWFPGRSPTGYGLRWREGAWVLPPKKTKSRFVGLTCEVCERTNPAPPRKS